MREYLIVANLTLGGEPLWSEVRQRMEAGQCHFHVLAPATHAPLGGSWSEADTRAAAQQRLDVALEKLRDLGAEADGEVGDIRTVDATLDALRAHDYDEVIVSTLSLGASRWLRMDLPNRIQRAVDVPVTHVVADPEDPEVATH